MAIMALPVPNKDNTFPQGYNGMNFSYKEGSSWVPVLETSSIRLEITDQSSFPSKTLSDGKVFLFNDYELGKKLVNTVYSSRDFSWKNNPNLKPSPIGSQNYYGNSSQKRPFASYNFITAENDANVGYEIPNYPTFSGFYSETGYGAISVEDYNQYCSNKTSTWLNPVMEIAPKIIQSYSLPEIDTGTNYDNGSWKILWRSLDIGAGRSRCALMSLVYYAQFNSYREYYDVLYPYEKLLGVFLPNYLSNNRVTLII